MFELGKTYQLIYVLQGLVWRYCMFLSGLEWPNMGGLLLLLSFGSATTTKVTESEFILKPSFISQLIKIDYINLFFSIELCQGIPLSEVLKTKKKKKKVTIFHLHVEKD